MDTIKSVYELMLKAIDFYQAAGRVPPQCIYDTIAKIESTYDVFTGEDVHGNKIKEPLTLH